MKLSPPEGYYSTPPSGKGAGVLVLHAWWGLSEAIEDVCNRLSEQGFIAFAPDLYRGKLATTIKEAEILSDELDSQLAMSIVKGAADFLSNHNQVDGDELGVIGFSLGAYFALNLSTEEPERIKAVVIFYGSGEAEFKNAKAAYLGHFAETDPYEPTEYVDYLENAISAAGLEATFHRYSDVGHWFFERDRLEAYEAKASQLAWDRSVSFLKKYLRG